MNINNGTYDAVATNGHVYENAKGNLIVCFEMQIPSLNDTVRAWVMLADSNGEVKAKSITRLKDVFGWDGKDPFWLEESSNLGECSITIVNQPDQRDETKSMPFVQFINRRSSQEARASTNEEKSSILKKYGDKLRALAAVDNRPSKPAAKAATTKPVSKPTPTAKKESPIAAAQPKPKPKQSLTSTFEDCWEAITSKHAGCTADEIEKKWNDIVLSVMLDKGMTEQSELGPAEWGLVKENIENDLPF